MAGLYVTWEISAFSSRSLTVLAEALSQGPRTFPSPAGTGVYQLQSTENNPKTWVRAHRAWPPRGVGGGAGSRSRISYRPLISWWRSSSHLSLSEGRMWGECKPELGETLERKPAPFPTHPTVLPCEKAPV